jgi:hypothetical protein
LLEADLAAMRAFTAKLEVATCVDPQRVALFRGSQKPARSFFGIVCDTLPVPVANAKIVLCLGESLVVLLFL